MIIQGSTNTNRDEILINKYKDLLLNGVDISSVIVVVLNPYKKNLFLKTCESAGINTEKAKIFTLNGLFYNTFKDNISYIKSVLKLDEDAVLNQCGLEISQYIFKQCIKEADFSDYISKVNLLHQLFRRYSLIVQNCLTDNEVKMRSEILGESFASEANKVLNFYKQKTIEYKSFDYLRQMAVFPYICKKTEYFSDIKYLIVDDADEMPYIFWQFLDYMMPKLKDYIIAFDADGSSRSGYLCAYKKGISDFISKYNPEKMILNDNSIYSELAQKMFLILKNGEKIKSDKLKNISLLNRQDMLNKVLDDIKKLISTGVKPNDIVLVTPLCDDVIKRSIQDSSLDFDFQIVSGNEKLSDFGFIKHVISILKITNDIEVNDYEIKGLLLDFAKIPYRKCFNLIDKLKKFQFDEKVINEKYIKLKSVITSLKNSCYKLTEQIKIIYENLIEKDLSVEDKTKYEFFLKEAQNFEQAFFESSQNSVKDFIIQIENSVISENPINAFDIKNNKVLVSTPQKIIDFSIKAKYQFWLDVSSSEWIKQDTGTLYNAWVFNRDWDKDKYSLEDNMVLTRERTARCIRKLMLLAQKEILLYSSIYDNQGNENFGGLTDYIISKEDNQPIKKITPRNDQKSVLDYKNGKMGIMAVPGAGKTTILLALITKLIESGVSSENIFVLTYMESAAKNFKQRIKLNLPSASELPNISTIHGLALRIIKENGNYSLVGLDDNFEICDDSEKEKIIRELFYKYKISDDKYENYLKSISVAKLSDNQDKLNSKYKEIQEFYTFLEEYNKILKSKNLIDYDDMLRFALQILKMSKETAEYYQNICKYIIEDEAQDSTQIQQELINILTAKYKNYVRCGDINQSITSTFTNSNLESFKKFISENKKVEMVSSQRCAEPIYKLANKMIDNALCDDNKKDAFYKISIKPTENNPKSEIVPEYKIFEHEKDEKEFVLNKIKEIQNLEAKASIGILLRLNTQVNAYNEYFNQNNIRTVIRTDSLCQKEIYKYIYIMLCIIEKPENNKNIEELACLYTKNKKQSEKSEIKNFIETLKKPFISLEPDEINNETLNQLYWDIDYHLNNSDKSTEEMAIDIGRFYSKDSVDISNVYLISVLIRRLKESGISEKDILKNLDYYGQKPNGAYKFFENIDDDKNDAVNIMTMHKSKGDEFDYVFIPQLTEDNYTTEKESVKLKSGGHFVQTIKHALENTPLKTPEILKKEQTEETLRLLYVGITRARKGLLLTCAKHYLARRNSKESIFIQTLFK